MNPFYQEGANLMKILYAASEATPFAKSGGLADVAGSLPKALVKDGVDARVIMPLYGDLKSVSYTHLHRRRAGVPGQTGVRHCCRCAGAVSYTHLDVYKRQPLMWWTKTGYSGAA